MQFIGHPNALKTLVDMHLLQNSQQNGISTQIMFGPFVPAKQVFSYGRAAPPSPTRPLTQRVSKKQALIELQPLRTDERRPFTHACSLEKRSLMQRGPAGTK